ncbi:hypothetical protein MAR_006025, partial [Mya arenaria]
MPGTRTAYEPGHKEACMNLIERLYYNVNSKIPSNGLTLFLCACLSGDKELIMFMLKRGADVRHTTNVGDTALYLATFGVLSHLEAAKLLEIPMPNPHVWDIVDHHTPPHISLGLQSPQRKHLIESTRRMMSPR